MIFLYIIYLIIGVVIALTILHFLTKPSRLQINGKHALITGGSSGIGLATAITLARKGASTITILARSKDKLLSAQKEISAEFINEKQQCHILSVDVSDAEGVIDAIQEHINTYGTVDILITSAGASNPAYFEHLDMNAFDWMMKVNFLGTVACVKGVLPSMKKQKSGSIVFISSAVALVGTFGYTAYGPSKWAVRGFAESLRQEVAPYNVYVTVSYPADVKTPMLESENKHKPEECKILSESGGVATAEQVAESIVRDMIQRRFRSTSVDTDNQLLGIISAGFTPASSVGWLLIEALSLPILRIVAVFYLRDWKAKVQKCYNEKTISKNKKQ